uniref:Uncharacterized protein n=1 Tax=Setaria viridis TaxID=4556 RepID=A0A4U6W6Y9_SETVI|nr:hypothetical protein SEVIR_2G222900v2 [Setaria viridis]
MVLPAAYRGRAAGGRRRPVLAARRCGRPCPARAIGGGSGPSYPRADGRARGRPAPRADVGGRPPPVPFGGWRRPVLPACRWGRPRPACPSRRCGRPSTARAIWGLAATRPARAPMGAPTAGLPLTPPVPPAAFHRRCHFFDEKKAPSSACLSPPLPLLPPAAPPSAALSGHAPPLPVLASSSFRALHPAATSGLLNLAPPSCCGNKGEAMNCEVVFPQDAEVP